MSGYSILFGLKIAHTFLRILIAIGFGLIFSVFMWPHVWKKIYQKRAAKKQQSLDAKRELKPKRKLDIPLPYTLLILALIVLAFILGTIVSFDTSYKNIDNIIASQPKCDIIPCSYININCGVNESCECQTCTSQDNAKFVRIDVYI
jgi:hypothetical protein